MMNRLAAAVLVGVVGGGMGACSGKGAQGGAHSSSLGSPPSSVASAAAAPALPTAAPASPDTGGCGDFDDLERRIGDGMLTAAEERCLRGRLASSMEDSERYRVVHLLTIDLDSNGMTSEATALRIGEMRKIDCAKVEDRLRSVCELQRGAAR